MSTAVIVAFLVGLIAGLVIGWLAHSSRSHASEDAARSQSTAIGSQVAHIVEPLRTVLSQLSEEVRRTEHHRVSAYAGLSEQVRGMHAASAELTRQTRQLANALHTPQIRGRWGELQLERVVELAGMSRHCDFSTQMSVRSPSGQVRPDLVVHLAGGRHLVVDAKVPLHSYLAAVEADAEPAERAHHLADHARALRAHIKSLASKEYWAAFENTPEMVVLFVPSDPVLEAAVRADPDLLEFGFTENVVLATPSTLIALLRTVALGWRHDAMARDAATIHQLGVELHHRISGALGHLDHLGGSLRRAVDSFNTTVGAIDSRVGVTARKLAELDALHGESTPDATSPIDVTVRNAGTIRPTDDDQWATSPGG